MTLVAAIRVDPVTGHGIAGHECDPEARSMTDIEAAFNEWLDKTPPEKRVVIYEGDERVFEDRDEAVRKASDSGFIQFLANEHGVPALRGESTDREEAAAMHETGVTIRECAALRVIRGLSYTDINSPAGLGGYIHFQAALIGVDGFQQYTETDWEKVKATGKLGERLREIETRSRSLAATLNELSRPALSGVDLFVIDDKGAIRINDEFRDQDMMLLTMDTLGWDGPHRINEIARLNMEVRDRAIFSRTVGVYNQGKCPLLDYGRSHIICLEDALRTYVIGT